MGTIHLPPVPEVPRHLQPQTKPVQDPEFPVVRATVMLIVLALLVLTLANLVQAHG